ncbi:vWA domain-containing protein [Streptomonospora salina]|uniref:Uncharacterized protein YegL n=1 Tax=Streptomonospora salina TaxID=104205 RepID=A0A841E2Y7_9ACTN|nr:VWA domain-containing protein [Streptomonospora salina]MBB5998167.1 uncharacterized protein YegL [Streptomonospora salina]
MVDENFVAQKPEKDALQTVLPVYLVLDTSGSMKMHEDLLNRTVEEIHDVFDNTPEMKEFIQLAILTFNTEPHLVMRITEFEEIEYLPTVACQGLTNYGPMLRKVRNCIEEDVPDIAARNVQVLRPAVFLLTDGQPNDKPGGAWHADAADLRDPEWRPRPHVIAYGFADASADVLGRIATDDAFVAEKGQENSVALKKVMVAMLKSVVASAKQKSLVIPEHVEGFRSVPLDTVAG